MYMDASRAALSFMVTGANRASLLILHRYGLSKVMSSPNLTVAFYVSSHSCSPRVAHVALKSG